MSNGTSQTAEEKASRELDEQTIGEEAGSQVEGTEPESTGEEESVDLGQLRKDYEEATRKITEQGQQLAEMRQLYEQEVARGSTYRNALASLGDGTPQQQDPMKEAEQRYLAASEAFDEQGKLAALRDMQRLREQQIEEGLLKKLLRTQELTAKIPVAQEMLGIEDQDAAAAQLNAAYSNMTPDQIAAATLFAKDPKRLREYLEQQDQATEEERRRGEAIQQMIDLGGGGSRPMGMQGGGQGASQKIDWWNFKLLSKSVQQELLERGVEIINKPGED